MEEPVDSGKSRRRNRPTASAKLGLSPKSQPTAIEEEDEERTDYHDLIRLVAEITLNE